MKTRLPVALALIACAALLSGLSVPFALASDQPGGNIELQGAGATFPFPLYSKWISEYNNLNPQVRINYQSIGSGGGIKQILERTVDFGASDAIMSAEEQAKASAKIFHIPTTLGAVVLAYNLEGFGGRLRLAPATLAGIFLGQITTWNDPKIQADNPKTKIPAQPITVVYRSDGSGTTAIFTQYLTKVSPEWKEKVGTGKSVSFPAGLGAKGNEGVSGQIKTTPGSIGYTELAYANQTGLSVAAVQNRAGKFVEPTLDAITAAAANEAKVLPEDLAVSIVDAWGETSYPIAAFTYILVYQAQTDAVKGKALVDFLWWSIHDGQKFGASLSYAPLPGDVVKKIEGKLGGIASAGKTLLSK